MSQPERLYGRPTDDEYLYSDPETVVEMFADDAEPGRYALDVLEWTVVPAARHLPIVDDVTEWLTEWIADRGDLVEHVFERMESAIVQHTDDIKALLDAIAGDMTGAMADRHVATLRYDVQVRDGSPLYVVDRCERREVTSP